MERKLTFLGRILRIGAMAVAAFGVAATAGATTYDLTTAGASATVTPAEGTTFLVQQVPDQSTGTGVIEPFLRVQNNTSEAGFNTDKAVTLDAKAGTWTHALLLSDIPVVNIGGTDYRQILLDVNQNSGQDNELLSLNQLQLFLTTGDPTSVTTSSGTSNILTVDSLTGVTYTELLQLSSKTACAVSPCTTVNDILFDYSLNPGSGAGDAFFYIPSALFTANYTNLVLFSQFGSPNHTSNDGFEEFAVIGEGVTPGSPGDITVVPEPASMLLLGTGLGMIARRVRRRRQTA